MNKPAKTKGESIHRCDVCGRMSKWGPNSSAYGSFGHEDCGARVFKTCSPKCREKAPSYLDIEYIIGTWSPSSGGTVKGAHWDEWDNRTGRFS